jgi:glycosyltransferase involved in cell wall biosynthesis
VRTARVCHVITLLELGGAQQNTLYTLAHLDRERFEPMLVSGKGGLLDPEAERIPSLHRVFLPQLVRPADPAQDAQALFALFRVFREWRPDIVHTHSSKAGILGRWAAHLAGVPVIVHTVHGFGFHSGQPARERRLFRWLEAATSRITTRVLAVSRTNLEEGVAQGVLPRGRVSLVRSGISLSDFRNGSAPDGVRERLGIPRGAPVAGMIGCLKPQKAPLDWVRACARIAAEIPAAHFLLVGDGELREAVETEVARLGLEARFHLLGWRRDIPGILRSTQVIALPSLWEGLPRVIPEAMASGLPVVATRVDGTPEAVEDGVTGFLVDPHDVEGLARRVARLLADPDEARRMGERARTRVGEFDIDEMVRRQEAIYEDLLQGLH